MKTELYACRDLLAEYLKTGLSGREYSPPSTQRNKTF